MIGEAMGRVLVLLFLASAGATRIAAQSQYAEAVKLLQLVREQREPYVLVALIIVYCKSGARSARWSGDLVSDSR